MQDFRRTSPDGGVPPHRNSFSSSDSQKPPAVARTRFYSGYTRIRTLESFQHRDFGFMWAVMFCMSISGWIINVATGWLTYELTSSPLMTGLAIGMAPSLQSSLRRLRACSSTASTGEGDDRGDGLLRTVHRCVWRHRHPRRFSRRGTYSVSASCGVSGSFLLPVEQAIIANIVRRALGQCVRVVAFAGALPASSPRGGRGS